MYRFLLFIAFMVMSYTSFTQLTEKWLGHYSGDLSITNHKGEVSEVYMELSIEKKSDTSHAFIITYGKDTSRQVRNYELIHDKDNQFVMDEKNGIILPSMLFKNRLVSVFKVKNNLIQVSYAIEKNRLVFRTTSSQKSILSGGRGEVPKVQGFLPYVDQYAVLKKKR